MHREGHYGAALLAYAPVGGLALALGFETAAVAGAVVAVGGAMVPDVDHRLPGVSHRGMTHTVWFALLVGAVLGAAGWTVAGPAGAGFGFLVGVLTVGAHLLADVLTPMGIRPFAPLRDRTYSLNLARAANPLANYLLLALGVGAAVLAVLLAGAPQG